VKETAETLTGEEYSFYPLNNNDVADAAQVLLDTILEEE